VKRATDGGKPRFERVPVVAWDEDGHALVVDRTRGVLQPARSLPDFADLVEAADPHQIIPGGGWLTEWRGGDDGEPGWIEPVLAWRINSAGWGEAIFTAGDGSVEPEGQSKQIIRYFHPDGTGCMGPTEPTSPEDHTPGLPDDHMPG